MDKKLIHLIIFLAIQVVFLIFFATGVVYENKIYPACDGYNTDKPKICKKKEYSTSYPSGGSSEVEIKLPAEFFFIYLPLIYAIFRDFSASALFLALFAGFFAIEWGAFTEYFFFNSFRKLGSNDLVDSDDPSSTKKKRFHDIRLDFEQGYGPATAVVLTFGALLGTINLAQLFVMTFIETIFYSLLEQLAFAYKPFRISDRGGAIVLFSFAAFFALGCGFMLNRNKSQKKGTSNPLTAALCVIGLIYTVICEPFLFQAGEGRSASDGIISMEFGKDSNNKSFEHEGKNMYYAIIGSFFSCVSTSLILNKGKIILEEIVFSVLCGKIIIYNSAFFILYPSVAFVVGILGAVATALCFKFVRPILESKLKYYDAMGIFYWFGIPGFLSALIETIVIASMTGKNWSFKHKISEVEYERDFSLSALKFQRSGYTDDENKPHLVRTVGKVAGFVFLYEILVMIIATVAGGLTGLLLNLEFWGTVEKPLSDKELFLTQDGADEGTAGEPNSGPVPVGSSERLALKS